MKKWGWFIFILTICLFFIPFSSAANDLTQFFKHVYDEIDDSVVNASLWRNGSTGTGGTTTENAAYIQMQSMNTGATSGTVFLNSTNLTAVSRIKALNISINTYVEGTNAAFGTIIIKIFGQIILTTTSSSSPATLDNTNWTIVRNLSNSAYFDYYNDGVFVGSFVPADNVIAVTGASAGDTTPTQTGTAYARIYYVYYYDANDISLDYPSNTSGILENFSLFNATVTPIPNYNLSNLTLYVWNSTGVFYSNFTSYNTNQTVNLLRNVTNLSIGNYYWNVYACASSFCNYKTSNNTFFYGYIINSETYNPTTEEGVAEEIKLNITYDPSAINVNAILVYNGQEYSSTEINNGNNVEFTSNVITPAVASPTNVSFYWRITLDDLDANTTTRYQMVNGLNLDTCTTYTNKILNITIFDELTKLKLPNGTIETAVNIYNADRTQLILNISNISTATVSVCLSTNITSLTGYRMDAIIKYYDGDYAVEYYNIYNSSLNSTFTLSNINLYDLNLTQATEFSVSFTGNDYLPLKNALIYLERQYVSDNNYQTVELPLTGATGNVLLHVKTSDVNYNIRVVKDGVLVANFEKVIFYCPNPGFTDCELTLSATSSATEVLDFSSFSGLIYSQAPTFNSATNFITFDFIVADGTSQLVSLNITRSDVFGNRSICTHSLNSASGTLNCNIGNISNSHLIASVYLNGEPVLINSVEVNESNFGSVGYFFWFIATLILILMFGESKEGVLASMAISYIGAVAMGIAQGNIIGIGSAGIWILIITVLGIYKINKGREQ